LLLTPEQNQTAKDENRQMECQQHVGKADVTGAYPVAAHVDHVVVGKKADDGNNQGA
jgi:hypothetical protein